MTRALLAPSLDFLRLSSSTPLLLRLAVSCLLHLLVLLRIVRLAVVKVSGLVFGLLFAAPCSLHV